MMDAKTARDYITTFKTHIFNKGMDEVKFANGDIVKLDSMSDEQAIRVAGGLMEIEAEAAKRTLKRHGAQGRN